MVIINSVLYPPGSLSNLETSSTVASTGKFKFKVGERKLRKKRLPHLSKEMLQPNRGIPFPLPSDYLNGEEASRDATLRRMSTLSAARSPARHWQSGENYTTIQKQGPLARSAACDALSSHPLVVLEAVKGMPGSDVSTVDPGNISTAVEQGDPPQRKALAGQQKSVRFEENLQSRAEKCERLDTRYFPTAAGQSGPSPRGGVERTQRRGARFAENLESQGEKHERLERERDDTLEKCEALERILNRVYQDRNRLMRELQSVYGRCHSLEQEFGGATGRRAYLENEAVDLRKRFWNLETEAAAQQIKLNNDIDRGRLREAEIREQREGTHLLQAELTEQSHDRSRTGVDQWSGGGTFTATTQTLQADPHLQLSPKGSPADSVLADDLLLKEDPGRPLYDITDVFGDKRFGFQHKFEASRQRFPNSQIARRPAAKSLINCSSSNVQRTGVFPQAELKNAETVLARQQPMLQDNIDELGAIASSQTLQEQTNSIGVDQVTDMLSEFLPTSSQPTSQLPSQQLPELDPDTSSEDNDTESDRPNTNIVFRSSGPRIQTLPAVHRVRILSEETNQMDDETSLVPYLNTWEWSSVPDLQLCDPNRDN
jgi:hypothetical protein